MGKAELRALAEAATKAKAATVIAPVDPVEATERYKATSRALRAAHRDYEANRHAAVARTVTDHLGRTVAYNDEGEVLWRE